MTFKTIFTIAALSVLLLQSAEARKLYKYQDADGVWHFSDRPPQNETQNVETTRLPVTRRSRKVALRRRGGTSDASYHIINEYRGPVEVQLELAERNNVRVQPQLPHRFIVPGGSEIKAIVVRPQLPRYSWSFQPRYQYMLGDPNAAHEPQKPYLAPFAPGHSFPISQGFGGEFSHSLPDSEYAVDIAMPEGTPIHAARDGVVMDVANDFYGAGTEAKYMARANLIRILHDDGTMAVYAHLHLDSAQVSPGMRVSAGQFIARSGNTGFSTGPHLHFVVQKNAGMRLVSVPFEFAGENDEGIAPESNMMIYSYRRPEHAFAGN